MTDPPHDPGTRRPEEGPSAELQRRALDALADHPGVLAARSHAYCEPTVGWGPPSEVFRNRRGRKVLLVAFHTADAPPETMTGGGTAYQFLLHPDSLAVLHHSTGTWRA